MLWAISEGQADILQRARSALEAGLDRLVLRETTVVPHLLNLAAEFGERVVLHTRMPSAAEIATITRSGVHLPGSAEVREWRGLVKGELSQSCHSVAEAHAALAAGCDWVFLSPIFQPISKPSDDRPTLGVEGLAGMVALGGITIDRLADCRDNGAVGVATMSQILNAENPGAVVLAWRARWEANG